MSEEERMLFLPLLLIVLGIVVAHGVVWAKFMLHKLFHRASRRHFK